jgi:hypothetical protein
MLVVAKEHVASSTSESTSGAEALFGGGGGGVSGGGEIVPLFGDKQPATARRPAIVRRSSHAAAFVEHIAETILRDGEHAGAAALVPKKPSRSRSSSESSSSDVDVDDLLEHRDLRRSNSVPPSNRDVFVLFFVNEAIELIKRNRKQQNNVATVIPADLLHFIDNGATLGVVNSPDNGRKRRHRFALQRCFLCFCSVCA